MLDFDLIIEQSVRYRIDYKTVSRLQKFALTHLGLSNLNQLRDRFDGQAYLDKFLTKSFAEIALQRILKEHCLDLDKKAIMKFYSPSFSFGEDKVELIATPVDSYPIVPKGNYNIAVIVFVNISTRETFLAGWCNYEDLKQNVYSQTLSPLLERSYIGYLKNFRLINSINDIKRKELFNEEAFFDLP